MQFEKKLFCHPAYLIYICEEDLDVRDCVSIVGAKCIEQMIFLAKAENGTDFEVRIYKANSSDNYAPHKLDEIWKSYEANDEFATFIFEDFISARQFVMDLETFHPEYQQRPTFQKS